MSITQTAGPPTLPCAWSSSRCCHPLEAAVAVGNRIVAASVALVRLRPGLSHGGVGATMVLDHLRALLEPSGPLLPGHLQGQALFEIGADPSELSSCPAGPKARAAAIDPKACGPRIGKVAPVAATSKKGDGEGAKRRLCRVRRTAAH